MISLSVVIITYNEEKNIGRCLESVKDIADEIVVVDSFSTDKTEEICRQYHTKFIKNPFEGHIEQKNFALKQVQYQHVLSIDADECLSEELKQSIAKVKENWVYDGYYFNRLTNYCGKWIKHCGWYPDKKLRLFNSKKGSWGGVNPHDKYIIDKDAKIQYLKGDLLHYSFYTIYQHMEQINKFSTIKANGFYKKGKKAPIYKLFFNPIITFLRHYIIRLGFLDGFYGFVISVNSSHSTFLKYVKLRSYYKNKSQ